MPACGRLLALGRCRPHSLVQAHAEQLAEQSKIIPSEPEAVQVAVQARSFQAKAQSLEKAAEAQDLQARAVVHAHAQVEAQAQAHQLVAQANDHAQAYAHASAQADQLKKLTSTCELTPVLCNDPSLIRSHAVWTPFMGFFCQLASMSKPANAYLFLQLIQRSSLCMML